jgi:hypothetical protein
MLAFLQEIRFLSPIPGVNEAIRLNHYLILQRDLQRIKLGDSDEIRKHFANDLERQFYRSMETPKTAVGINAATIVGEAMTQLTLKLKGQVGTSSAKTSENLMEQASKLLGPSNSFKDRQSTIFFTPQPNYGLPQKVPPDLYPLTFQDVFSEIPRIVDTIVGDLVETKLVEEAVRTEWLDVFSEVYPDRHKYPVPYPGQVILRLGLRRDELVTREISPSGIATAIQTDPDMKKLGVKIVWAPLGNAELWVWTDDDDEDILEANVLRPVLEFSLGGVKTLTNATPTVISYLTWIDRERFIGKRVERGVEWDMYELTLSHVADTYPWRLTDFIALLERIPGSMRVIRDVEGLPFHEVKYQKYLREMFPPLENDRRYGVHILRVEVKKREFTELEKFAINTAKAEAVKSGKKYDEPKSLSPRTLLRDAEQQRKWFDDTRVAYMTCSGSNLADLLSLPGVNNRYTYSNAARDVVKVLGIEASWRMFVEQFMVLFDNLLPQFAILLADFMHMPGSAASYSATGQKDQGRAAFGAAALERAAETLVTGAPYNVVTRDVNVKLALGHQANIGTGAVSVLTPKETIEIINQNRLALARGSIPYAPLPNASVDEELAASGVFAKKGANFVPPPRQPVRPPVRPVARPPSAAPSPGVSPFVPPSYAPPSVRSPYLPDVLRMGVNIGNVTPVTFSKEPPNGAVPANFRDSNQPLPADLGSNASVYPPQRELDLYSRPAIVGVSAGRPPPVRAPSTPPTPPPSTPPLPPGAASVLAQRRRPRTNPQMGRK